MELEEHVDEAASGDDRDLQGVYRYYELAKRAEWQVRDLPWGEVPPIPEYKGSRQKLARRRDLWRSVVTQQLQADELAVEMAAQLFSIAPDHDAKLYYTTMVQDESRHTEAWLKLIHEAGGMAERDPYLDQLAQQVLEADTLEEKVFLMQVFYERLIIPRFRMIARSSRGTVLEDLCNRLAIDDGIHHGAGMAYERVLLEGAGTRVKTRLVDAANRLLPIFAQHALWRPKAREFIGALMRETDIRMLREDLEQGIRLASRWGSTRAASTSRTSSSRACGARRRSAKSCLEPRVVPDGGEIVVCARLFAKRREQLDPALEVVERLVAGFAGEGREARKVVVKARVVRHALEPGADLVERIGVALLAVGGQRVPVELPRLAPVDPLVGLAGCPAEGEDRPGPGRLPPRLRRDEHERSCRRIDRLAVDLEGRRPVEHDVQLFLARSGLVVLVDEQAVLTGLESVDAEGMNTEVLAHRNVSAAPLHLVEARDLPLRTVGHSSTSIQC